MSIYAIGTRTIEGATAAVVVPPPAFFRQGKLKNRTFGLPGWQMGFNDGFGASDPSHYFAGRLRHRRDGVFVAVAAHHKMSQEQA